MKVFVLIFYGKIEEIKTYIEVETRSNIAKSKFPVTVKIAIFQKTETEN